VLGSIASGLMDKSCKPAPLAVHTGHRQMSKTVSTPSEQELAV
jgi:hypothetical protein